MWYYSSPLLVALPSGIYIQLTGPYPDQIPSVCVGWGGGGGLGSTFFNKHICDYFLEQKHKKLKTFLF